MSATKCLREEHQLILQVLDGFAVALREAREQPPITAAAFNPFLEFFRGFADACHHCKEEGQLFPSLAQAGIPGKGGPIEVMLYEHELARGHVRAMSECLPAAEGGDEGAFATFFENAQAYLELLRAHIDKEDHCLFSMADQVINGTQLTTLTQGYLDEESTPEYCATMSRCRAVADELLARYATPSA